MKKILLTLFSALFLVGCSADVKFIEKEKEKPIETKNQVHLDYRSIIVFPCIGN